MTYIRQVPELYGEKQEMMYDYEETTVYQKRHPAHIFGRRLLSGIFGEFSG
jgi:hypothetical protein